MRKTLVSFVVFVFSMLEPQAQNLDLDYSLKGNYNEKLQEYIPFSASENTLKDALYANPYANAELRARDLISRMTFDEKLCLTGGVGFKGFNVPGVPRLGVRPVTMADASQGIRTETIAIRENSVSFPGLLPLAATWNTELAHGFGKAMAEECLALGIDILLAPGINMQRLSVGGRNFEYLGEDPLLTSLLASEYIKGLQQNGIIPTAKHFIGNDQDFCRHIADIQMDERTLREIYLRPWEYIIKNADCMGIMTGNNSVNGVPCVMNKNLTGNILRKEFKFKGIAMSDWQNSQYFPLRQDLVLPSGQSLLMPSNETFANWLRIQIANKPEIKADFEKQLDEMIFPTLYTFFKMGTYDRFPQDVKYKKNQSERQLFAQRVAEEAIVLLKNKDNILPISKDKKIVMIGPPEIHSGYGSGFVTGFAHTNYADGLKNEYGDNFSSYTFLNLAAIDKADIVIYNLNKKSGEGADYPFEEPKNDLDTLNIIIKHHKHVVVLINAANTFPSNWLAGVDGVLWCSYLGQERGNALAAIISGKVSPSGKLPFTFEKDFSDSPDPDYNFVGGKPFWLGNNQYKNYWLGKTSEFKNEFTDYIKQGAYIPVPYQEGVFMGYRWYDATNKPVEFPFGFGLSYTHFKYTNIGITNNWKKDKSVIVSATIRNIGNVDAKEIVQLYVTDKESSVLRPPKELKAFEKINLKVGESKKVEFRLSEDAFSFWCNKSHQWLIEPGKFTISIGSSSRNLPLKMALMLN